MSRKDSTRSTIWPPTSGTRCRCKTHSGSRWRTSTNSAQKSAPSRDGSREVMPPLDELRQSFPLGESWRDPKAYEEVVSIHGVEIALAGLAAESTEGEVVTGSAADVGEIPLPRAYFELLERTSIVAVGREPRGQWPLRDLDGEGYGMATSSQLAPVSPDPARWRYARSHGVAGASSWRDACFPASLELIGRDRIPRSCYGPLAPTP